MNERIRWDKHMDDAVAEVFQVMLHQPYKVVEQAPPASIDICATVLFSGSVTGECVVEATSRGADRLTDAMLGTEGDWDDEMVGDAVGELCNMVAGGWKSRLDAVSAACTMSVPAVSRIPYDFKAGADTVRLRRAYAFEDAVFQVNLEIDGSALRAKSWTTSPQTETAAR